MTCTRPTRITERLLFSSCDADVSSEYALSGTAFVGMGDRVDPRVRRNGRLVLTFGSALLSILRRGEMYKYKPFLSSSPLVL